MTAHVFSGRLIIEFAVSSVAGLVVRWIRVGVLLATSLNSENSGAQQHYFRFAVIHCVVTSFLRKYQLPFCRL
jgi:hypothetical protein